MPMYFINIRDGESVAIDPEGQEFASLDDVFQDVAIGAKELATNAMRAGKPRDFLNHKVFEIRDEAGNLIREVPFKDALDSSL